MYPKICTSWISFEFLPNQWLWTLTVTILSIIQHLTWQLNITTLTDFQVFSLPVGPSLLRLMRCDAVFELPSWLDKQQEWSLHRAEEGGQKRERTTVYPGITAASHTCFPRELKHLFSDFTLQSSTWLLPFKFPKASLVHIENVTIREGLNFCPCDISDKLR